MYIKPTIIIIAPHQMFECNSYRTGLISGGDDKDINPAAINSMPIMNKIRPTKYQIGFMILSLPVINI